MLLFSEHFWRLGIFKIHDKQVIKTRRCKICHEAEEADFRSLEI